MQEGGKKRELLGPGQLRERERKKKVISKPVEGSGGSLVEEQTQQRNSRA